MPRCIQASLPIADALSHSRSRRRVWSLGVVLARDAGTGLHPRPMPADDLQRYFPWPSDVSSTTEEKTTTTTTDMDKDIKANTNGSYIDPRWTPMYEWPSCTRGAKSSYGRSSGVEGRRPSLSRSHARPPMPVFVRSPRGAQCCCRGARRRRRRGPQARPPRLACADYDCAHARADGRCGARRGGAGGVLHAEDAGAGRACCSYSYTSCYSAGAPALFSSRDVIGRRVWAALLGHGGRRDARGGARERRRGGWAEWGADLLATAADGGTSAKDVGGRFGIDIETSHCY